MTVAGLTLARLIADAGLRGAAVIGDPSVEVSGVELDSRTVTPGALFCCLRGHHADGHEFAAQAVARGAVALLVDHRLQSDAVQVIVDDTRRAMGHLAAAANGRPAERMTMVGVTGTNGKTTTTTLIRAVLGHAGRRTGMIGTLTGAYTTPESTDLQRQLAAFAAGGTDAVVMEVSSHALALDRVVGTRFDRAVFTNLGRDHLDLHGTMERYFAAKALLFEPALSDSGIVNADDPHGRLLLDAAPIPMEPYSAADANDVDVSAASVAFTWRGTRLQLPFGGTFNVMNALAAATTCASLGVDRETIAGGLLAAPAVPGRFEPVATGQPFSVVVDYSHKPDALAEALVAARHAASGGRVIVVFGAGGERDPGKRPLMGAAASRNADLAIITSDNPRSEDPQAIIDAIVGGVPAAYRDRLVIEPDRRRAIARALDAAGPGDVVLLAGKGNETTQTIGDRVMPFDDRAVARELLEEQA